MRISPALVLFFLAPAIAELLSGSAPPTEFFNPISLLLLSSLYGSGALIVRELKIRWNKGYVSMFVLGAAYGIIEEGLMVKSFFDPKWMDLGILGVYGRWMEVNWVWTEWLTIYHAIFSIAIPVVLVELAYPKRRNEKWIGNKKLIGLIVLLSAVTAFGYLFLTDYRPPLPQYLLAAIVVVILTLLAWRIPFDVGKTGNAKAVKSIGFALFGFFTSFIFFMLFGAGPYLMSQPLILMALGLGFVFLIFCFLKRYDWNEKTLDHKFALTAGTVAFLIVLALLQELDKSRPDNTQGMSLVGIVALVSLILLGRRLHQR